MIAQGRVVSPRVEGGNGRPHNVQPHVISQVSTPVQIPELGSSRIIGNVRTSVSKADASLGRFYPSFLRIRIVPERHAVLRGEVDRDLTQEQERTTSSGRIGSSDSLSLLKMKRDKEETEEVRSRFGRDGVLCIIRIWILRSVLGNRRIQ